MAFLKNAWYCAGWSNDLTVEPTGIKILNEDIVLYRNQSNEAVALSGICPHRFAPLSRGQVVGDRIQCGYHGLEFDDSGKCVHNPHGRGIIPPGSSLRSYPLAEQSGALWIWMGDKEKADESLIPNFDFVENRTDYAGLTGYLKMDANYQLVIDNLLDLTHSAYIHTTTVGVSADKWIGETKMEYNFSADENTINSDYIFRNSPPTPLFALFSDLEVGDIHSPMALHLASSLILDLSMTEPGQAKDEGYHMPSAHLLVPETEHSCHYFYAISRNAKLDDDSITEKMGEIVRRAFQQEDAPMIRDCNETMGDSEFFSLKPLILETDKAAVQARRVLAKRIREEQRAPEKILVNQ